MKFNKKIDNIKKSQRTTPVDKGAEWGVNERRI